MIRTRKLTLRDYGRAFMWLFAIAILAFGLCACRTPAGTMDKAIAGSQAALAGLDIAVDKGAKTHQKALSAAVEICRSILGGDSTPEERTVCLHQFLLAPEDIAEFETLLHEAATTYDQLVDLLPQLERLRDLLKAAQSAIDQKKGS